MFQNDKDKKSPRFNIFEYIVTFFLCIIALKIFKYILPVIKQHAILKEILGLAFCIIAFSGVYWIVHKVNSKIQK